MSFVEHDQATGAVTWIGPPARGRKILLVDDCCSSGTTLHRAKAKLRQDGRDCLTLVVVHDPDTVQHTPDLSYPMRALFRLPWERGEATPTGRAAKASGAAMDRNASGAAMDYRAEAPFVGLGLDAAQLARLAAEDTTAADLRAQFATLTLGSGSAAMVLGRADQHPEGHRVIGGVSRAGTEHHDLCVGDLDRMRTDSRGLFEAGLELAMATWTDAKEEFDWNDIDWFVAHQTSVVHINAMARALGVDPSRFPLTLPHYGNMGPAAVPFTLARHAESFRPDDRILLLGIGSGLNTSYAELIW